MKRLLVTKCIKDERNKNNFQKTIAMLLSSFHAIVFLTCVEAFCVIETVCIVVRVVFS